MDTKALRDLVKNGEGALLEFKAKATFPEKIIKEIVAFANTQGGNLLLGVDDNGTISGLKFAEEEQYALERAIKKYCRPRIQYTLNQIPVTNKRTVLAYAIKEGRDKPHYVISGHGLKRSKKAYVRVQDKSIQASREIVEIMRRKASSNGTLIKFGTHEQTMMQYIEQHESITLKQLSAICKIPYRKASAILVRFVLSGVLDVIADEVEDKFIIKQSII